MGQCHCKDCQRASGTGHMSLARFKREDVAVGCMDDNAWFSPHVVVYAKDRPTWDTTSKDIPNFERMPPAKP